MPKQVSAITVPIISSAPNQTVNFSVPFPVGKIRVVGSQYYSSQNVNSNLIIVTSTVTDNQPCGFADQDGVSFGFSSLLHSDIEIIPNRPLNITGTQTFTFYNQSGLATLNTGDAFVMFAEFFSVDMVN